MSIRKFLKIKYDGFLSKYEVSNKMNEFLTSENLRIFAWLFILTRIYNIYQTVNILLYNNNKYDILIILLFNLK
jgi:hypothetical protein